MLTSAHIVTCEYMGFMANGSCWACLCYARPLMEAFQLSIWEGPQQSPVEGSSLAFLTGVRESRKRQQESVGMSAFGGSYPVCTNSRDSWKSLRLALLGSHGDAAYPASLLLERVCPHFPGAFACTAEAYFRNSPGHSYYSQALH